MGVQSYVTSGGQLMVYEEIPAALLTAIEDVLFNRHPDATEKLVELAGSYQRDARIETEAAAWRSESLASPRSKFAFAPRWKPRPSHVGHQPSGLLNE